MSHCKRILENIFPIDPSVIRDAFDKLLKEYFEDVTVSDVEVDQMGGIYIEFADSDDENNILTYWHFNEDKSPEVVVLEPDEDVYDNDSTEYETISLEGLAVKTTPTLLGTYLDLSDPIWVSEDTMQSIVSDIVEVDEVSRLIIRGGKKVRKPLIRRKRRKIRTSAQRIGMKRAVVKRKAKIGATKRKLAKSLKIRKRSGLHKQSLPRGYKVQGTK